nr:hypothetical protein [Tanacetum cinerariifolium]
LIVTAVSSKFLLFGLTNCCCSLNAVSPVDKKNVIITEATIRDDLRLDDAASVDCLPNEEIFIELSRMSMFCGCVQVEGLADFLGKISGNNLENCCCAATVYEELATCSRKKAHVNVGESHRGTSYCRGFLDVMSSGKAADVVV